MSRKVSRHVSRPAGPGNRSKSGLWLVLSVIAFALSLGSLVQVYAITAEARTHEDWYSYQEEFRFDYTARVSQGSVYASDMVRPADLFRQRLPVEPVAYRRVLVTALTESIAIDLPYQLVGDRDATILAKYWIDADLVVPGLWQKPYRLMAPREVRVEGRELLIEDLSVQIPVREIVEQVRQVSEELKLSHDQIEIRIRPTVQVEVGGLKEPLQMGFSPEYMILFRGLNTALEIDEPNVLHDARTMSTLRVVPLTVGLLGMEVKVATLRMISLVALTVLTLSLGLVMAMRWLREKAKVGDDLKKLGSGLIQARGFELPAGAMVVEVPTVDQMIAIHLRTDRPVIQAGSHCYLVDGTTCYRLAVKATAAAASQTE